MISSLFTGPTEAPRPLRQPLGQGLRDALVEVVDEGRGEARRRLRQRQLALLGAGDGGDGGGINLLRMDIDFYRFQI